MTSLAGLLGAAMRSTRRAKSQAIGAKFVSYYRVSTDRQGRSGLGLEGQRALVERYLAGVAGTLIGEHVEVESGRWNDRPALQAALGGPWQQHRRDC